MKMVLRYSAPMDIKPGYSSWRKKTNPRSLIAYFPLIRHGPHRKHRAQQLFYCCMCIICRGNVFTEPLPNNIRGDTETHSQQDDLISLLLFFQNKESRLKNCFFLIEWDLRFSRPAVNMEITVLWHVTPCNLVDSNSKQPSVPIGYNTGWALEQVWTLWREEFLAPAGTLTPISRPSSFSLYRLSYSGVAENILNKQLRTVNKGWPTSSRVGWGSKNTSPQACLTRRPWYTFLAP
jgi:hypothetical protein